MIQLEINPDKWLRFLIFISFHFKTTQILTSIAELSQASFRFRRTTQAELGRAYLCRVVWVKVNGPLPQGTAVRRRSGGRVRGFWQIRYGFSGRPGRKQIILILGYYANLIIFSSPFIFLIL